MPTNAPLTLSAATASNPDGHHPALRLKGDWLVLAIGDGRHTGSARSVTAATMRRASSACVNCSRRTSPVAVRRSHCCTTDGRLRVPRTAGWGLSIQELSDQTGAKFISLGE